MNISNGEGHLKARNGRNKTNTSGRLIINLKPAMRSKIYSITSIVFFLFVYVCDAQDFPPITSLVYPGIDGRLVYVADSLGNKIPDFSNAGYKGGGVTIPYVPVKEIKYKKR
jgi:hypothetical protein